MDRLVLLIPQSSRGGCGATGFPSTLPVRLGGRKSAAHPVLGVPHETTALPRLVPGALNKILSVLLDCMICTCSALQPTLSCASLLDRGISFCPAGEEVARGIPNFQQAVYGSPGMSCPGAWIPSSVAWLSKLHSSAIGCLACP